MIQRAEDGQIYQVETRLVPTSRERISNMVDMLTQEIASISEQLTQKQNELTQYSADLASFDEISPQSTEVVDNPATPSVDELIPEEGETPAEEAAEALEGEPVEPFDGGAEAPQEISVEQAVEQGL